MSQTEPKLVPAVDRAIRMLVMLQHANDGKRLAEMARDLGIAKSSAHQIATTLLHHRVLDRDPETRRFSLGPGIADIAKARYTRVELPSLALPHLEALATTVGMTALLGVADQGQVVLAAKVPSPDPIDVSAPIGLRLDARAGIFGKLLQESPAGDGVGSEAPQPSPGFTSNSIVDPEAYARELRGVRQQGYAIDVEEYLRGIAAVGATVRGRSGAPLGALFLIGMAASHTRPALDEIGETVRESAAALSAELGYDAAADSAFPEAAP